MDSKPKATKDGRTVQATTRAITKCASVLGFSMTQTIALHAKGHTCAECGHREECGAPLLHITFSTISEE